MLKNILALCFTVFLGYLAGTGLIACSNGDAFSGSCTADDQCPVGAICRGGLCVCRSDEACAEGQFCNMQGVCQKREGCTANSDCKDVEFCDIASGNCIARTACGTDVHCDSGSVCDTSKNQCVQGCRDAADCPLYSVCDRTGTSSSGLGRCVTGRCDDKSFCDYGQKCTGQACVADPGSVNCKACTPGSSAQDCNGAQNFCLINTEYDPNDPSKGSSNFCATECTSEADCGNGYECGSVVLLTQNLCMTNADCGGGGRQCFLGEGATRGACSCATNDDCNAGLGSQPPTCAGSCGGLGIRSCLADTDCTLGRCDLTRRSCTNPRGRACTQDSQCDALDFCADAGGGQKLCLTDGVTRCNTNNDCLCNNGTCFGTGRPCTSGAQCMLTCQGGGCLLGHSCAPIQGLSCVDLPHR